MGIFLISCDQLHFFHSCLLYFISFGLSNSLPFNNIIFAFALFHVVLNKICSLNMFIGDGFVVGCFTAFMLD